MFNLRFISPCALRTSPAGTAEAILAAGGMREQVAFTSAKSLLPRLIAALRAGMGQSRRLQTPEERPVTVYVALFVAVSLVMLGAAMVISQHLPLHALEF
jgi:hypothetical protein